MNTIELYNGVCLRTSRTVTRRYSTSFSLGVRMLHRRLRDPIHAIYGFVRLADEIVDTFHQHDKRVLLERFTADTWRAIDEGISLNPVLQSFQLAVNRYGIDRSSIETFLRSMAMDLDLTEHDRASYERYVLGSAEVVGLMCLRVFCEGDEAKYKDLEVPARRLGAAFQKVNFLRDLRDDRAHLGRTYFPQVNGEDLTDTARRAIEQEIHDDFHAAFDGIKRLPEGARLGVYLAYRYYTALSKRLRLIPTDRMLAQRIRVPNSVKMLLLMKSWLRHSFNLL